MPLPVAHGLVGASIVAALHPRLKFRRYATPLLFGALLANAADADFLLVSAFNSKAWHRGFSHSVGFSLLVCLVLLLFFGRRRMREALVYGLAYASHGVLDCVTTKDGAAVELLWPFSTERLMLGWWGLSEVPSRLPPAEIVRSLAVEFAIFTPILLVVVLLRKFLTKRADAATGAS